MGGRIITSDGDLDRGAPIVRDTCPVCKGSGVERLVPVSEIVAWLRQAPHGHHFGEDPNDQSYALHGRDWFADEIERRFAGVDASTEHRRESSA
jgi:hypothetical protein